MTTTPIAEVNACFAGMQVVRPIKNPDGQDNFQQVIESVSAPSETKPTDIKQTQAQSETKNDVADDNKTDVTTDNNRDAVKNEAVMETEPAESKELTEEEMELVEDVVQKILDITAQELGISTEELEDILAQMGLTALDLLNPENVTKLVVEVKADGDAMSLVTNETFSDAVLNLNIAMNELVENAAQELGMEPEKLQALLEKAMTAETSEKMVLDSVLPEEMAVAEALPVDEFNNVKEQSANRFAETQPEESVVPQDSKVQAIANAEQKASTDMNHAGENSKGYSGGFEQNGLTQPTLNQVIADEINAIKEDLSFTKIADTREIISQITEQMQLHVREDVTELRMQLNPESLGTVNLTLAAKEGNITAQLAAQTEAVRAALETQIYVIKENLEQQGIKIEAVEVTVASHEFDRSYEENSDQNELQDEMQEELKKATRKIDVSAFTTEEEIEELDESEQVTAKMMRADGNSMDYKV